MFVAFTQQTQTIIVRELHLHASIELILSNCGNKAIFMAQLTTQHDKNLKIKQNTIGKPTTRWQIQTQEQRQWTSHEHDQEPRSRNRNKYYEGRLNITIELINLFFQIDINFDSNRYFK